MTRPIEINKIPTSGLKCFQPAFCALNPGKFRSIRGTRQKWRKLASFKTMYPNMTICNGKLRFTNAHCATVALFYLTNWLTKHDRLCLGRADRNMVLRPHILETNSIPKNLRLPYG